MSLPGRKPKPVVKMRNPNGEIVDVELSRNGDNPHVYGKRVGGRREPALDDGWSFVTEKPQDK